ncbi:hypothetical protein SKAU_G00383590 [Synaphobranchus kaupii]|uniref:PLA2c domain-containing protein n=1 Tax=Synaphobranchus kaupii TaxID=118154 RepID=A0A9Q1IEX3_SYNKA|nr:hypothetical protein SKAU_G00383590 [Synaphobranchus kaupii]
MVKVAKCLKDNGIQPNSVPHIAVLGSGGGERAMIGLLGCIDQLYKANLLDSILYLCGVSGSTWCMASMYEDAAWSSKVPSLKDNLVKRLTETRSSDLESIKWLTQAVEHENFSLTDIWAAHVVYGFIKKIDTTCLSDLKNLDATNPYPIYTATDQVIKHKGDKTDCSFELSPHEVGYSHVGAFVDTSSSRSQFEAGVLKQKTAERDMLYLQGLCGSALADREEIHSYIWQWIKKIFTLGKEQKAAEKKEKEKEEKETKEGGSFFSRLLGYGKEDEEEEDGDSFDDMATEMVESILQLDDCEDYKERAKLLLKILAQCKTMLEAELPEEVLSDEKTHLEDAGLVLNSPYAAALRPDRKVKLILSFDFSAGDPFLTVTQAAEHCKQTGIPFPPVDISEEDRMQPKDFYVFKSENTPTVIHIPLFNMVNCEGDVAKWSETYKTFRFAYDKETMDDLIRVSGLNVANNKNRILQEIWDVCK